METRRQTRPYTKMTVLETHDFIEEFRQQECLWKQDDIMYSDRRANKEAILALARKFCLTEDGVREKIKSLRTQLARTKRMSSGRSRSSAEDAQVTWHLWDSLQFLLPFVKTKGKNSHTLKQLACQSSKDITSGQFYVYIQPRPSLTDGQSSCTQAAYRLTEEDCKNDAARCLYTCPSNEDDNKELLMQWTQSDQTDQDDSKTSTTTACNSNTQDRHTLPPMVIPLPKKQKTNNGSANTDSANPDPMEMQLKLKQMLEKNKQLQDHTDNNEPSQVAQDLQVFKNLEQIAANKPQTNKNSYFFQMMEAMVAKLPDSAQDDIHLKIHKLVFEEKKKYM